MTNFSTAHGVAQSLAPAIRRPRRIPRSLAGRRYLSGAFYGIFLALERLSNIDIAGRGSKPTERNGRATRDRRTSPMRDTHTSDPECLLMHPPNSLVAAGLNVVFSAPDDELRHALVQHLVGIPGVAVSELSLLDMDVDAIVSPANSFGWMDGGLDLQLLDHYGPLLQTRVREHLAAVWGGELPVGMASSVALPGAGPSFLVLAPTMRVPMRLPADTVNPYLAVRAALLLALGRLPAGAHRQIRSIAIPGMGTGVGGGLPADFARQARAAIDSLDTPPPPDWWEGARAHQLLYGVTVRDLQADEPAPPVPADGDELVVEDTITPLGDQRFASLALRGPVLVGRYDVDDGWDRQEDEFEVPVEPGLAGALQRSLALSCHGDGRALMEHLKNLPGTDDKTQDEYKSARERYKSLGDFQL
jgi:O-acetyl-ADP-ribose deacetylase (regulator of RNase III)